MIKAEPDAGLLIAYADTLEDMQPRALELAFNALERRCIIPALPSPGEIRAVGAELLGIERRREREEREQREREQQIAQVEAERSSPGYQPLQLYPAIVAQARRAEADRYERIIRGIEEAKQRTAAKRERRQMFELFAQLEARARAERWEWWASYCAWCEAKVVSDRAKVVDQAL